MQHLGLGAPSSGRGRLSHAGLARIVTPEITFQHVKLGEHGLFQSLWILFFKLLYDVVNA